MTDARSQETARALADGMWLALRAIMTRASVLLVITAVGCCFAPLSDDDIHPAVAVPAPPAVPPPPPMPPAPVAPDTPDAVTAYRAVCGVDPGPLAHGSQVQAMALRPALAATDNLQAAAALICRPGVTEAELGLGYYYATIRAFRAQDPEKASIALRAGALLYSNPIAIAQLGRLHFDGPNLRGNPFPRDLGAAYCEVWAAMEISARIRFQIGSTDIHNMTVNGALEIADSYETPSIRAEFDPAQHRAETGLCMAQHIARYEARFGPLPPVPRSR